MASVAAATPEIAGWATLLRDYSLEITARDGDRIAQLAGRIAPGTQIAITSLPGENMADGVHAARQVRAAGFEPVPHISARRLTSADELDRFLAAVTDGASVDRVFVVAGDLPQPAGPYADALAVIRSGLLSRHGIEQVGITGYPEGHPQIGRDALDRALHDKLAALREAGQSAWIATQFAFDADPILAWLDSLHAAGVDAPVRLGVAGPASVKSLLRFAARCGVGVSAKVVAKYGLSLTQLLGSAGPEPLLTELSERLDPRWHGRVQLHLYPFGGLDKTADWLAAH